MEQAISFEVPGIARPGGSKRGIPFKKKGGGLGVRVIETGTHTAAWRDLVAMFAFKAMNGREPFVGPLRLTVTFHFTRPKAHLSSKGLVKASAPSYPAGRPDTTKLVRALEDAISGICWVDDAQVVKQTAFKCYALRNFAHIHISPI